MTLSRFVAAALLSMMFAASFLIRAHHPVSRPEQWLMRSYTFDSALAFSQWADMYQSRHPGFTVMAIGGLSLRAYKALADTPAAIFFNWAIPSFATEYGRDMAVGVIGLSLVISSLNVLIVLALRRLSGWTLALAGGGMLTFAPFLLSHTRVFHVDALVSTLMLLSGLLALIYGQEGQRCWLLLSGLVGGTGLLTKVPSLFLIPFTGLVLLVYTALRVRAAWHDQAAAGRRRWLLNELWRGIVLPLLLWLLMAAIPFAFWPAMWVMPLTALRSIILGTGQHVTEPHILRFFAGQLYTRVRPPITYYPVTLAFNSSFVTLTLALAGIAIYVVPRWRAHAPLSAPVFGLMLAYAGFFILQMTIGAKEVDRYILPAHAMVEVIAAAGLAALIGLIQAGLMTPAARSRVAASLLVLATGLQAAAALPYAPDYGAQHNHLLGGNLTAVHMMEVMPQNEGVLFAAAYLNRQPRPETLQVGVLYPVKSSLIQYFAGEIPYGIRLEQDFYIYNLAALQRDKLTGKSLEVWQSVQGRQPDLMVTYDGVPHLWVYARQPQAGEASLVMRRGWAGLIAVAWLWAFVLIGMLWWAARRLAPGPLLQESAHPADRKVARVGDQDGL